MTPDRWQEIKELVHRQFEVEYEDTEELEGEPGSAEVIEFNAGQLGIVRLEYTTKPRQTGRRSHTAGRPGSMGHEEVLYSTTENIQHLKAFLWKEEDDRWAEIDQKTLAL